MPWAGHDPMEGFRADEAERDYEIAYGQALRALEEVDGLTEHDREVNAQKVAMTVLFNSGGKVAW